MDDLIARLTAAIDKRERIARAVKDNSAPWDGQWKADGTRAVRTYNDWVLLYERDGQPLAEGLTHFIADNDPASVLRGCAADRKALAAVQRRIDGHPGPCERDDPYGPCDLHVEWNKTTLGEYALVNMAERYGLEVQGG